MKRFVMAVALTGVFSLTTLAGNVPTNDFVAPPSPPASTSSTNTVVVNLILTITTLIGR